METIVTKESLVVILPGDQSASSSGLVSIPNRFQSCQGDVPHRIDTERCSVAGRHTKSSPARSVVSRPLDGECADGRSSTSSRKLLIDKTECPKIQPGPQSLWGGQFCPQPAFSRPLSGGSER
jgi:hypothetical protein